MGLPSSHKIACLVCFGLNLPLRLVLHLLLLGTLLSVDAKPTPADFLEPRQSASRCSTDTFTDIVAHVGGTLDTGSPYTPTTEPTTGVYAGDPVLKYAPDAGAPDLCGVRIRLPGGAGQIAFELYLPSPEKWNRRFLTVGNGGFIGGTNRQDMFARAVHGWAVMSTNTGHEGGIDLKWAGAGDPIREDWAWRAMDLSVAAARQVVDHYYGNVSVVKSYYSSCSTGGRQGIRQLELNKTSFDGILIGAPAWNPRAAMPVLSRIAYLAKASRLDTNADSKILLRIAERVYDECNGLDGTTDDNMVRNSSACLERFRNTGNGYDVWHDLNCIGDVPGPNCVSTAQRKAFMAIVSQFAPPPNADPSFVGDGFDITSLLDLASVLNSGVFDGFDQAFSQYFLGQKIVWNDTDDNGAKLINLSFAADQRLHFNADPGVLNTFGGKAILYAGTADGSVATDGTRRAFAMAGGEANTNLRYFELPGMTHCVDDGLTDGPALKDGRPAQQPPWYIGGSALSIAFPYPQHTGPKPSYWYMPNDTNLNTPEHDALHALVDWVEGPAGTPGPEQLISVAFADWPNKTISKQRPICAAPMKQTYKGGNVNDTGSWLCSK